MDDEYFASSLSLFNCATSGRPSVRLASKSAAHRVTLIHAVEAACREEGSEGGEANDSERFFRVFVLDAFSPKSRTRARSRVNGMGGRPHLDEATAFGRFAPETRSTVPLSISFSGMDANCLECNRM